MEIIYTTLGMVAGLIVWLWSLWCLLDGSSVNRALGYSVVVEADGNVKVFGNISSWTRNRDDPENYTVEFSSSLLNSEELRLMNLEAAEAILAVHKLNDPQPGSDSILVHERNTPAKTFKELGSRVELIAEEALRGARKRRRDEAQAVNDCTRGLVEEFIAERKADGSNV